MSLPSLSYWVTFAAYERSGEHRRSILNHQQLSTTTPVSLHLNQAGHSIKRVLMGLTVNRQKRNIFTVNRQMSDPKLAVKFLRYP